MVNMEWTVRAFNKELDETYSMISDYIFLPSQKNLVV